MIPTLVTTVLLHLLTERQDVMPTLPCDRGSDMQFSTWSTTTIAVLSNILSYCEY